MNFDPFFETDSAALDRIVANIDQGPAQSDRGRAAKYIALYGIDDPEAVELLIEAYFADTFRRGSVRHLHDLIAQSQEYSNSTAVKAEHVRRALGSKFTTEGE